MKADRPYNLYHGTLEARPVTATTSKLVYTLMFDNSMLPDDAAREKDKAQKITQFTDGRNLEQLRRGRAIHQPQAGEEIHEPQDRCGAHLGGSPGPVGERWETGDSSRTHEREAEERGAEG